MDHRVLSIGAATLHRGDCLDILPGIESVDHVIADPPYEDTLHEGTGRIRRADGREPPARLGFSGVDGIRAEAAAAIVHACRGWAVVFSAVEGVGAWAAALEAAGAKRDTTLAWVKPDAMPRFNGKGAAAGFECVVTAWCGTKGRRWNGGGRRGVFYHPTEKGSPHPTPKPVSLMRELVSLYTEPGDLVLDPFMGGGATALACLTLGRRFVGIEKDPAYFEMAVRAIEAASAQMPLPLLPSKPEQAPLVLEPS